MERRVIKVQCKTTFRNPITNRMVEVGDEFNVPDIAFWQRRLRDKDVVEVAKGGSNGAQAKPADKVEPEPKKGDSKSKRK